MNEGNTYKTVKYKHISMQRNHCSSIKAASKNINVMITSVNSALLCLYNFIIHKVKIVLSVNS